MTRTKKLIISALMVLVTSFTFLGSSVFNIARSLFPVTSVMASNFVPGNTNGAPGNEGETLLHGDIITVKNIPSTGSKNVPLELPIAGNITKNDDPEIFEIQTRNDDDAVTTAVYSTGIKTTSTIFVEITDAYGNALTRFVEASEIPGEGGGSISLPAGMVINDPSQVKLLSDEGEPEKWTFSLTPSRIGTYKVQYFALNNENVWTNTEVYQIEVTSHSYSIEMQKNDSIVMPSTLRIDAANPSEAWAKTDVQISLPLLHDEKGKLIEGTDIILGDQQYENPGDTPSDPFYYVLNYQDIAKANDPDSTTTTLNAQTSLNLSAGDLNVYETYKTYTVKKVEGLISALDTEHFVLYVEVKNSESGTYKNYDDSSDPTLLTLSGDISDEDYSPYASSPYSFKAVGGKNVITYKLFKKDFSKGSIINPALPDSWLSHTVTGSTSYDSENIELAATLSSSIKATSVSYKEKIYLPSITATNKNNNNNSINVFYYYVVKVVKGDGTHSVLPADVVFGRDDGGLYFLPNASSGSKYEISYNIVDFYGNTVEDDENYNYEITITDRNAPITHYVKAYDNSPETTNDADLSDYSYIVASKYTIKQTDKVRPEYKEHPGVEPDEEDYEDMDDYNEAKGIYDAALLDYEEYKLALSAYRDSLTKIVVPAVFATDPSGFNSKIRKLTSSNFLNGDDGKLSGTININDNYGATTSTISSITSALNYIVSFEGFGEVQKEISDYGTTAGDALRDEKMADLAYLYIDPEFFAPGTYTLTLTVVDGQYNNNSKTREFKFELVEEDLDLKKPTVKFGNSTVGNVIGNQNISIPVPTITDEINERYMVKYYALIEGTGTNPDPENTFIPLSLDDTGKSIVFNTSDKKEGGTSSIYQLASTSAAKSFKVVAFVFNAYVEDVDDIITKIENGSFDLADYKDNDAYPNLGYGERKITVKYIFDSVAPKFDSFNAWNPSFNYENFDQYAELQIPGFVFHDDTSDATVTVSIVDTAGNPQSFELITNTNRAPISDGDYTFSYAFSGIKFTPTNADKNNYYTVTYTLHDSGGNAVSYSFVLTHANDKEGPTIQGIPGSTVTIELGQAYNLEELHATDNYSDEASIRYEANCLLDGKYVRDYYNNLEKTFSPREVGTFQIQLTAFDENNNPSSQRIFTIVVKDTLKPTIELLSPYQNLISEEEIDNNEFKPVQIPAALFAEQEPKDMQVHGVLSIVETKITIKAPTNDSDGINEYVYDVNANLLSGGTDVLKFTKVNGEDFYNFTPNARGQYTITYYCKDASGNEASDDTTIINVGDTETPNIFLTKAFKTKLDKGFVIGSNDSLNINIRARIIDEDGYASQDLYVKDNYGFKTTSTSDYDYVKVDITISDSSDKTLEALSKTDDIHTFQFTTSGTYKITFKVTDEVGNVGTYTRTFSVSTATSSAADAATIIGTVLIVVSAVILLGVLVYFIKGTKLISKKKTLKKTTKKPD